MKCNLVVLRFKVILQRNVLKSYYNVTFLSSQTK